MVCALFSHAYHVTHHVTSCHVTMTVWHLWCDTFPHFLLCSKSKIKEKEKKRNIDSNLAVFAKSWHSWLYSGLEFSFLTLELNSLQSTVCLRLCSLFTLIILTLGYWSLRLVATSIHSWCKGISLGQCLVTWVGSHLRAVISLIVFPCLSCFPFCDNSCDSFKSIIGQYVNICQVPWEQCLDNLVV